MKVIYAQSSPCSRRAGVTSCEFCRVVFANPSRALCHFFQSLDVSYDESLVFNFDYSFRPEFHKDSSDRFARGSDHVRDFFMGVGDPEDTLSRVTVTRISGPCQQKPGQLLGSRNREANSSDLLADGIVICAHLQGDFEAQCTVFEQM